LSLRWERGFNGPRLPKDEQGILNLRGMAERNVSVRIAGLDLEAINRQCLIDGIVDRIKSRKKCYICLINAYSSLLVRRNKMYRKAIATADYLIPDGLPLVWASAMKGKRIDRIRGTDLMLRICELSRTHGFSHYFYGGEPGTPEKLVAELRKKFPWLKVAGIYSPPFRPLGSKEHERIIKRIDKANPDVFWVGLGAPKQEVWMFEHRNKLDVPMLIGVGAAFDFLSGNKKQPPMWVQETGLEWLFRFMQDPLRLWKRCFWGNIVFMILLVSDLFSTFQKKKAFKRPA